MRMLGALSGYYSLDPFTIWKIDSILDSLYDLGYEFYEVTWEYAGDPAKL